MLTHGGGKHQSFEQQQQQKKQKFGQRADADTDADSSNRGAGDRRTPPPPLSSVAAASASASVSVAVSAPAFVSATAASTSTSRSRSRQRQHQNQSLHQQIHQQQQQQHQPQRPPAIPRQPRAEMSFLQRSDWVNLEGLVSCAIESLGKEECVKISELGRGSHNSLYELSFSDSTSCAASISNSPREFFHPQVKHSEIATMQYLAASPRYRIPVPRVFAWDLGFDNPVGAPYVLREVVPGKNMAEDGRFYELSADDRMKVIKELALVQAELSQPAEFDQIGSIYRQDQKSRSGVMDERGGRGGGGGGGGEFYVGELIAAACAPGAADYIGDGDPSKGPYSSLAELWQARLERETLLAIRNWSNLPSDSSIVSQHPPSQANPQQFGELLQLLSGLTGVFTPPREFETLCIYHSDLAIRNVLFDEKTLKITGVIDWEFASVVPLVITGRFPNDLGWEGNDFARSLGRLGEKDDVWNHHYYDWTSLEGVVPPPSSPSSSPSASSAASSLQETAEIEDYLTINHATTTTNNKKNHVAHIVEKASGNQEELHEFDDASSSSSSPDSSPPSPPLPPPPTSKTSQKDLNDRASRLVSLFYLRKYFASCVGSRDFTLSRLFIDSIAYVKFHELIMGGSEKWFSAIEWVEEVFWRLTKLGPEKARKLKMGQMVVRVPEIFKTRVTRGFVDLGEWEERVRRGGDERDWSGEGESVASEMLFIG